jgi:DNA-binding LacI/PurR family transcriptional regulator
MSEQLHEEGHLDSDEVQADVATGDRRPRASSTPGGKQISLRDVAREAKVSVATVSMVLNDNPRISRATHLRIQRIIEKLGYQPNRLAQSLSSKYTRVLAVMLPALRHAFADAYFGELISGIADKAGKLGYKLMLEQAKPDFIAERKHIQAFERRYIDGMLLLGLTDNHEFMSDFNNAYPAMVVDNHFQQFGLDHVVADYRGGAEQVMNYLLQLGHRKIGYVYAAMEVPTAREVMDIYRRRLSEAGQAVDESWLVDGKFTEEGGAEAAAELLRRHPDLTAVFCGNDKMAIGVLHYCNSHGIKVPQEVSVVGFDNLQHAAFVNPSLTTVHLPLHQVGMLAAERIIERITGRAEAVAETLSTHLIVRNSTAMARVEPERLVVRDDL